MTFKKVLRWILEWIVWAFKPLTKEELNALAKEEEADHGFII